MEISVKSPFAPCMAHLKQEKDTMVYHNETFEYVSLFYECEMTHRSFTTSEMSEINISQVYNQYREKHNIPYVDEIIAIRKKYGLSAREMSRRLNFGENQYGLYERGEMPSKSHGRLIKMMADPKFFSQYTDMVDIPEDNVPQGIISYKRGSVTGYTEPSLLKAKNVALFFIGRLGGVFKTKMNKLMFYADFLNYRETGSSITGLAYCAISYGIVPDKYVKLFASFDEIEERPYHGDFEGEQLMSDSRCDMTLFTSKEIKSLETVYEKFKNTTSSEISEINHKESVWQRYHTTPSKLIDYAEAFSLSQI